jgi:hypothetical protein
MTTRLLGGLVAALLLITPALSQTTTGQGTTVPAAEKTQEQILAEKREADQRAIERRSSRELKPRKKRMRPRINTAKYERESSL